MESIEFAIIVDLSGLTPEEDRSFAENEYGIFGLVEDYLVDCYWDEESRAWVLYMDAAGDYSVSELRDMVLREYTEAINQCKYDRYRAGLKANEPEVTFYDNLRASI